jgi:hypothetical protein
MSTRPPQESSGQGPWHPIILAAELDVDAQRLAIEAGGSRLTSRRVVTNIA